MPGGIAWNVRLSDVEEHAGAASKGFSPEVREARRKYVRNWIKRQRKKRRQK